ncbi:MAG: BACON domain-containing protein [Alistipes sp.]|nr:BACON domain-containing protein [Alistipes sp.]
MFAACEDNAPIDEPTNDGTENENPGDNPEAPDKEAPTLEINENLVSVSNKGGEYEITYTLTNPNDTDELVATCEANWVHDFDYSIDGTVLFTVDANETTESRIVYLNLEYGKAKDKVTISQSGLGQEEVVYEFDIKYDIDGPYVTMNVSAKPESTRYYAWYMSKKGLDEALAQSPGVDATMYLNRVVEVDMTSAIYQGSYQQMSPEEAVDKITFVGPSSQKFELNGETDFVGFVCPVNKVGDRLGDVHIKEFRTGAVKPSTNDINIVVNDTNTDRVSYTVNTTNQDQYAAMVLPAADAEAMTDEQLLAWFNGLDVIPYLHFGNFTTTALGLKENSDYYILAFGYEYGMFTTEVKREKVHTLTVDTSIKADFVVTVDKVTNFRIKATVDAGNATCLYYADWCYATDTAEELKQMIREGAEWYINEGYFTDLATAMKSYVGFKGVKQFDFTKLAPETEYRVFAVGIDETTGEFNTEVFFTDVIKTPAKQVSEAYIEIPVGKYYYDFDLQELYPEEFAGADGWAVLPLEVTTHGDVAEYYYDVYTDDLSDTTYPTDEEIILDLEINGNANKPLTMSYCYFDTTLTLIYFSKDTDDNFSPVTRKTFTLSSKGYSPAEDFDAEYGAGLKSVVYKSAREL